MDWRLALVLAAACWASGCAGGPVSAPKVAPAPAAFGPWSSSDRAPALADQPATTAAPKKARTESGMVDLAFYLYAHYLTRVDAARCQHRPTCSRYAVDALRSQGFLLGPMLTVDRLLRGERSSALRMLPVEKVEEGQTYFRDHVDDNVFY